MNSWTCERTFFLRSKLRQVGKRNRGHWIVNRAGAVLVPTSLWDSHCTVLLYVLYVHSPWHLKTERIAPHAWLLTKTFWRTLLMPRFQCGTWLSNVARIRFRKAFWLEERKWMTFDIDNIETKWQRPRKCTCHRSRDLNYDTAPTCKTHIHILLLPLHYSWNRKWVPVCHT